MGSLACIAWLGLELFAAFAAMGMASVVFYVHAAFRHIASGTKAAPELAELQAPPAVAKQAAVAASCSAVATAAVWGSDSCPACCGYREFAWLLVGLALGFAGGGVLVERYTRAPNARPRAE